MHGDELLPWNHPVFDGWSIVGMNHFHYQGARFLFVSMTKDGRCIKAEGEHETAVFARLRQAAREME